MYVSVCVYVCVCLCMSQVCKCVCRKKGLGFYPSPPCRLLTLNLFDFVHMCLSIEFLREREEVREMEEKRKKELTYEYPLVLSHLFLLPPLILILIPPISGSLLDYC